MANLKIFTEDIEQQAIDQINQLVELEAFEDAKVRIMPDVHSGSGCVIGFTADLGEKVIPNVVGVDIGCGMLVIELGQIDIDFEKLDNIIHTMISAGMSVHTRIDLSIYNQYIENLCCQEKLKNIEHIAASMGTLGGGWQ